MNIQVAGIVSVKEALLCVGCGANIIGLLVGQRHQSTQFITKKLAKEIKNSLPKDIKTTLITHLQSAEAIIEITKYVDVDYIQLHSSISEEEVIKIKQALPDKKIIRVIHVSKNGRLLTDYTKMKTADFYFTDSRNQKTGQVGGTGLVHNFETDRKLVQTLNKPVFIAGGLTPENVGDVVRLCRPFGVDVNSGCKGKNGLTDKKKMEDFVRHASV